MVYCARYGLADRASGLGTWAAAVVRPKTMQDKPIQQAPQKEISTSDAAKPSTAQHVLFLDGMRGAAALYVVLFHLATVLPRTELPSWVQMATEPFTQGHLAVGVFIVLSGYLLMLPPARSESYELRGGLKTFLTRRSRRILPPYYAALLLSVPPELYRQHSHGEAFSWGGLISHLFMVHNLRPAWVDTINGPMWSVAVEFQIYLVFALLLLPICRRFGGFGTAVVVAWILGMLPALLLPSGQNFVWSRPWYLGLFALGMTGAMITQQGDTLPWTRAANRFPWMLAAIPCFVASACPLWHLPFDFILRDLLIGVATLGSIVCGVRAMQQGWTRGAGRAIASLFGSRVMIGLGAFSYSLYLIHFPLLSTLDTLFKRWSPSLMGLAAFQFLFVLPATLIAAYLFYLAFERPFVGGRSAARAPIVPSA